MYMKLDLQFFNQEKTEKASPKKRDDTKKKGQVAKSNDVNTSMILLLVFLFMFLYSAVVGEYMFTMAEHVFSEYMRWEITAQTLPAIFQELAVETALVIAPIMLIAVAGGVMGNMVQVGVMFAPEAIKPKFSKLNPIKGLKRIFSARALVELAKSFTKIILVTVVSFTIIWMHADDLLKLSRKSVTEGFMEVAYVTGLIGVAVAFLLLLLAIPDYVYQKHDHEKQIKMSKQDVKDEHKKSEGDPKIKSKRRQKQQEMATQRMMQEVPKADVVVTNPTHFAVALKYDEANMDAPVITAKGADHVALRIKQRAKRHEVITVEDKPLARGLYEQADIGDEIPEDMFKAVAELLAYVYRLQKNVT
ncbi:flagellar biosynthetic protein FlhB [Salsuginibacillus halophilus]|uniref:Flagellar biosynthetic protein FlhB n=1 Tax=Salsuginibacillus halophilus TaxID=517424 RepID=A0A2P8HY89_9BACI|nr:flagellar biosynthesis protein FlhB [Salsuginibacillus halophilus]PSL51206.1 flagellar biosynthetic protein FlhB [Salsuginibacillus halophilus]